MAAPAPTDRLGQAPVGDGTEARIVAGVLDCIARWGVAKTTVDDVARAAGVSRATLYRAFPGGREVVLDAVVRHETARFFAAVTDRLDEARTLEDLLVVGIVEAARFLGDHEALGYVLAHEPERILPALAFHRLDRSLAAATAFAAPHLRRFLPGPEAAERGADWVVRLLLSYATDPSPLVRLTDPDSVRPFVARFVVPVLDPSADTAPKEP